MHGNLEKGSMLSEMTIAKHATGERSTSSLLNDGKDDQDEYPHSPTSTIWPCSSGEPSLSSSDQSRISEDAAALYGYEEAAPDSHSDRLGRTRTAKEPRNSLTVAMNRRSPAHLMPRRSSLKQTSDMAQYKRRATITFGNEYEVCLPGRDEPVRRRSSIKFHQSVKVKVVTAARDMVKSPEKLWFQDEEYKKIREKAFHIIEKVGSKAKGANRYCSRGLENMLDSGTTQQRKYDCWDTVLDEQDQQRESGTFDEECMAHVYRHTTSDSQVEAERRASADEAAIRDYMESTRKQCRRMSMY